MLCRILVGSVFIYAAIYKIADPCDFAKAINGYHILPPALINLQAVFLPWMEIICGVLIIQGAAARASSVLICGMLMLFITAIGVNLLRGISFECGCFGAKKDICDMIVRHFFSASDPFFKRARAVCDLVRDALILVPAMYVFFYKAPSRLVLGRWRKKHKAD